MAGTKRNPISDEDLKKALDKCFVITSDVPARRSKRRPRRCPWDGR